ncbi:MAG: fatty acid CoA ligase family protein [Nitrospinota bacterium]|nr:fatty acid CoA ligase family protein [Nitrospinota bacterium]
MTLSKNMNTIIPFCETAKKKGNAVAVAHQVGKKYKEITFADLDRESTLLASGLVRQGIGSGVKTLLMVKPGIKFVSTAIALFKAGAVPVFIDPGMGLRNLFNCVEKVEPEAFIGIPKAHIARLLFRSRFRTAQKLVTIGPKIFWGGSTYNNLIKGAENDFTIASVEPKDTAAIIFTTGSTGPPKGVIYTHAMFRAQTDTIREQYGTTHGDVDLAAFPLFALFSVSLGMKAVIPDMDPTKPAKVDPLKIVNAVNDQGVTFTFGSPAIWERVSSYCEKRSIKLPTLKKVLMAGAPVSMQIHERLLNDILTKGAETHTPYGATEALPIADMKGSEVLSSTGIQTRDGKGICVGSPLRNAKIRIIKTTESEIPVWDNSLLAPSGEKGEIVVQGSVVSIGYLRLPEQTGMAKITDGDSLWHRMGDIGYFDDKGRLWFCGRKNHRVITSKGTLYSVCTEAIFNRHPAVLRSALVGLGSLSENGKKFQHPVIVIELKKENIKDNRELLTHELLALGAKSPLSSSIKDVLYYYDVFPTDIRHNAKIFREKLKFWAEQQLPRLVP